MITQQPDYVKGRQKPQAIKTTGQVVPYQNLDQKKLLKQMLKKNKPILQSYEEYVGDLELRNVHNVDTLNQHIKYEHELAKDQKSM